MQTFLPYEDFRQTAACLDYRRLGKQRVEAWQILNILLGTAKSNAWAHHPAVLMWSGSATYLAAYGIRICEEWRLRGYKDTMCERFIQLNKFISPLGQSYPLWLGNKVFHSSHRSNLIRKDQIYYSKFGWTEDGSQEYIWPTKHLTGV